MCASLPTTGYDQGTMANRPLHRGCEKRCTWLRANAENNIDPTRIGATGNSAGAHLSDAWHTRRKLAWG